MEFTPEQKSIKNLLISGNQFIIPRFQREYSWEKKNYEEFFVDMMNNLIISDNDIKYDQYFLGTMLFIGSFVVKSDKPLEVIDGQQRLTTITILFSVLSDRFRELQEKTLSEQLFKYITTTNDDGEMLRVLVSKSSYPYFVYYIQDIEKREISEPNSEEEECIKETYQFLYEHTSEEFLKRILYKRKDINPDVVENLNYLDILKALRDQVLNCTFISIATTNRNQANKIFEILNSKGKRLAYVDLIKNKIFDVLKDGVDGIFAEEIWGEIKEILNNGDDGIGFATFFRHYWISKYSSCSTNALYENFKKKFNEDTDEYKKFLKDLKHNAENYMKIINPKFEDYQNRKEKYWLVQSLRIINKDFNVVKTRVMLLALFDIYDRGLIDSAEFKKTIIKMEKFHFIYTTLCTMSSNKFESKYSVIARKLRKCINKAEVKKILHEEYFALLEKLFPTYEIFERNFLQLSYSKKDVARNIKTKYVINILNSYYSGKEVFEQDGSVEHILPEEQGGKALNIGNLILLEMKLNNDAGSRDYIDKIPYYHRSQYPWIRKFLDENSDWDGNMIDERAKNMARILYEKILKQ